MMTSSAGQRMLGYLPPLYENSRVMQAVLDATGTELDSFRAGAANLLNQLFVQTADWSLDLWEAEFGFSPAPGQTYAERRSRVLGRMRGHGTLTIRLLKQVAESYDNGQVDVIPDFAASVLLVRFIDTRGVPPNLSDLQEELKRLAPVNYTVQFEFNYFQWSELDAQGWTWADLDALGLTWTELETYA